jgi:hypothetical protein
MGVDVVEGEEENKETPDGNVVESEFTTRDGRGLAYSIVSES